MDREGGAVSSGSLPRDETTPKLAASFPKNLRRHLTSSLMAHAAPTDSVASCDCQEADSNQPASTSSGRTTAPRRAAD